MRLSFILVLSVTSCHASLMNQRVLNDEHCSLETTAYDPNPIMEKEDICLPGHTLVNGVCQSPEQSASVVAAARTSCGGRDTSTCPPSGTLGIRYGRCYTLSDLGSNPITRFNTKWPYYYFGRVNALREIIFRVCRDVSEASCSSPSNEYVLDSGKWFLQDRTGFGADGNAKFVGTVAAAGGWYVSIVDSDTTTGAGQVVDFEAKIRCLFGKCLPCVRLHSKTGSAPKQYLGLTNYLWSGNGGDALFLTAKSTTCYPILFQETACSFP